MFCTKCGTQMLGGYCLACGTPAILQQQPTRPQQQYATVNQPLTKKKNNGCLTAFVIVASIFVFVFIIGGIFSAIEPTSTTKSSTNDTGSITTNQLSESDIRQDYIDNCEIVLYKDLNRNPQNYIGKKLAITGKISQYLAGGTFYEEGFALYEDYDLSKQDTYMQNRWYVNYEQPQTNRILENDIVTFYGEFSEMIELESIFGAKGLFPKMIAKYHVIQADEEDIINSETTSISSRLNPIGLNKISIISADNGMNGKVKYEVEMVEIKSGSEALEFVEKANEYNEPPENGKEYIVVKFRFKVLETEDDESLNLGMVSFDCISGAGVEYTENVYVVGIDPSLDNELFQEAEHTGYVVFMVDTKDMSPVVVMAKGTDGELWFDIRTE